MHICFVNDGNSCLYIRYRCLTRVSFIGGNADPSMPVKKKMHLVIIFGI